MAKLMNYFIHRQTKGTNMPVIIDGDILKRAEDRTTEIARYVDPADYDWFCAATGYDEALSVYWGEHFGLLFPPKED